VPAELGRRAAGLASCGRRPAAEEALTLRVSIREIGQQYYLLRGNIEATTLVLVFVCLRSGNVRDRAADTNLRSSGSDSVKVLSSFSLHCWRKRNAMIRGQPPGLRGVRAP
jgi:hypothetical protein